MGDFQYNRRKFLQIASFGGLGLCLPFSMENQNNYLQNTNAMMVYVGTYTNGKSEGIYLYKLNAATGELTLENTTKISDNPSFLAIDPQRKFLFAVNEIGDFKGKKSGAVSAFSIDGKTGKLTLINQQPSLGGAPCYIIADKQGKNVLVANYGGGNVAVLPVDANGTLGTASHMEQHTGSGVNAKRQEKPHAHCIVLAPDNKYVFVADLGIDKVMIYRYDASKGKLLTNEPASVSTKPGAGPRHFTFHPDGKHAFLINELNSTLTAYAYDASKGSLAEIQTLSTLPKDFSGENYCADIHVSPDGKFIYGSNRGHNSIAVFGFDQGSGKLTYVENVSTGGKWPRNFALDPSGKWLLVANQNTDSIVTFRIDNKTGKLTPTGKTTQVPAPVCLAVIPSFS